MDHQLSPVLSASERRAFVLNRLFSLSGIVPIGVFLIVHLWTYSSALLGRDAFEQQLEQATSSPWLMVAEGLFVWLPLIFHAGYGLSLTFSARVNVRSYPYARNWAFVLQRVTGVLSLFFIAYHFWQFRLQIVLGKLNYEDLFPELCASLSSTGFGQVPWLALAYLLGIAASVFHLANGLHTFCFSWGITRSRRAGRRVAGLCGALGVGLFLIGANSVVYFATGSRLALSLQGHGDDRVRIGCGDLQKPGVSEDRRAKTERMAKVEREAKATNGSQAAGKQLSSSEPNASPVVSMNRSQSLKGSRL